MRDINDHKVNPVNDTLKLQAIDVPSFGGASHVYRVSGMHDGDYVIKFQKGPIGEAGVNGLTHEVLLSILADRMRSFQSGPYATKANACALTHIEEAMHWLQQRTLDRMRRSVEGTSIP